MTTTQTITMREQIGETLTELFEHDERLALVLADISLPLFEKIQHSYPTRSINVGIMEQTMISVATGYALEGFIPCVHTISPFLVERPYEQIKDDFCYQQLGGNFISTGASYDYSTEGMTHHGPADVALLSQLPGMQIVIPGTAGEFDQLLRAAYDNGSPTYYRTSIAENATDQQVAFGKLSVLQRGSQATLIAVGPMLQKVLPGAARLDVTLLYCTTLLPFGAQTLRETAPNGEIIIIEPYYEGGLLPMVSAAMEHLPTRIKSIGVPHQILKHYGTPEQHDEELGLTTEGIDQKIRQFLQR
ncbi:transketolase [Ktedonobacteria bacterium brp13]|nr:transketolase [Ktedonobacteria bacterium brp13]